MTEKLCKCLETEQYQVLVDSDGAVQVLCPNNSHIDMGRKEAKEFANFIIESLDENGSR